MTGSPSFDYNRGIEAANAVLTAIFSWVVLLGISVIVTGKITCRILRNTVLSEDKFTINFVIFKISAIGDEVLFGFLIFLLVLLSVILFGGAQVYDMFKNHSGIDIGQWNSICVLSSLLSVLVATLIFLGRMLGGSPAGSPIITKNERKKQIEKLQRRAQRDERQ